MTTKQTTTPTIHAIAKRAVADIPERSTVPSRQEQKRAKDIYAQLLSLDERSRYRIAHTVNLLACAEVDLRVGQ